MNKLALCFLVVLSLLCFSCEIGRKVSDRVDGKWLFSYKKTWEYKNPGKEYGDSEKLAAGMIGVITMEINAKEKTISTQINNKPPEVERYRVVSDQKDKFAISMKGGVETFEFPSDGVFVMCPSVGGTSKCMAFILLR